MTKKVFWCICIIASFLPQPIVSQRIKGNLVEHKNQLIQVLGFDYYETALLGESSIDSLGNFDISYPKEYRGMAILKTQDNASALLILNSNNIELKGKHLSKFEGLNYVNDLENSQFLKVAKGNALNDQAYAALRYLKRVYADAHFDKQHLMVAQIQNEVKRLEESTILDTYKVSPSSYLYWYTPHRKLISDMPQTLKSYTERLPENIARFRAIDFTHPNLKTSGLIRDLIEGHYLMLENMGQSLDSMYLQMNGSTDYLIKNLKNHPVLLNKVSKELYKLFEKRSLFEASAHLSSRLLDPENCDCGIEEDLKKKMQKYVQLKVGNIAPDIQLNPALKLSDIQNNILLVFGSSACKFCKNELSSLQQLYKKWKAKGTLEVVYISLDTNKNSFEKGFENTPWKTFCDFKGWQTKAAQDYFVNATPTYILLDKNRKILLHPKSVAHVDAWKMNRF